MKWKPSPSGLGMSVSPGTTFRGEQSPLAQAQREGGMDAAACSRSRHLQRVGAVRRCPHCDRQRDIETPHCPVPGAGVAAGVVVEAAGCVLKNGIVSLCRESLHPLPCCHGSGLKNTDIGLKIVQCQSSQACCALFVCSSRDR